MGVSLLVIQIAIIFLPGIIWARLDLTYGKKGKLSDTEFLIRAFMFGMVTYAITFLIFAALGRPFAILSRDDGKLVGLVARRGLLKVRARLTHQEHKRSHGFA